MKRLVFFIFISIFCLATKLFALSEMRKFNANELQLKWSNNYFLTSANYTKNGGVYESLPSGYSYKLFYTDLGARYTLNSFWALRADTQVAFAESKDPTQTRTNSQLNKITLGTDFLMVDRAVKLIPDFQFVYPLGAQDQSSVQTHEGAIEATGRLLTLYTLSNFNNHAFAGFTFRNGSRSSLLIYGLGSELIFSTWSLGAEIKGFSTAIEDQTNGEKERTAFVVNSKSAKFNTVNPTLLESNFWYKNQFDKFALELGAGFTMNGSNTAAGTQVFLNFLYDFKPAKKKQAPQFIEDTQDGVDQILFQPEPSQEEAEPRQPEKPKKTKKTSLQDELNKTEMQIELKKKKGK